jgi:hypothetical protein
MGEKGRMLTRKIRTLRRRTTRWFTPPVRPGDGGEPFEDPGERALRPAPKASAPSNQRH